MLGLRANYQFIQALLIIMTVCSRYKLSTEAQYGGWGYNPYSGGGYGGAYGNGYNSLYGGGYGNNYGSLGSYGSGFPGYGYFPQYTLYGNVGRAYPCYSGYYCGTGYPSFGAYPYYGSNINTAYASSSGGVATAQASSGSSGGYFG